MKNCNKKRIINKLDTQNNSYVFSEMVHDWYMFPFLKSYNPYKQRDYKLNGGAEKI